VVAGRPLLEGLRTALAGVGATRVRHEAPWLSSRRHCGQHRVVDLRARRRPALEGPSPTTDFVEQPGIQSTMGSLLLLRVTSA
jgi:hypothetical protein